MFEKYIGIDSIIAAILYFIAFLRMPLSALYNDAKIVLLIGVLAYCLFYFGEIDKRYKNYNITLIIFGGWIVFSSFINRHNVVSTDPFKASLFFAGALVGIAVALEVLVVRIGYDKIIDVFFKCSVFVNFVEDVYIFFGPVEWRGDSTAFLLGSKFAVMYQHLILFWLLLAKTWDRPKLRIVNILYVLYALIVALKVDSVTGIVGFVLFAVIVFLIRRSGGFFFKPYIAVLSELLAFAYVFVGTAIMSNEYIVAFIDKYMGGSSTMMSRVSIYETVFPLIAIKPILGFGYQTTYELGMQISGFSNTQNSLYEWAWYAGWPAAVMILIVIYIGFHNIQRGYCQNCYVDYFIVALFYVYVFLGSIEILMQLPFFSILAVAIISTDRKTIENNKGLK